MNYSNLSEEMRLFVNKALEIYLVIKDKKIVKNVRDIFIKKTNYEFTEHDKKILSLFLASFLAKGRLKMILSSYDDIKVENILKFIGIKDRDIILLPEDKYERLYDKNLKDILRRIIRIKNINESSDITPIIIMSGLRYPTDAETQILNYFYNAYNIRSDVLDIYNHPLFVELDAIIRKENTKKDGKSNKISNVYADKLFNKVDYNLSYSSSEKKSNPEVESQDKIFVIDDSLWKKLELIKKKFVGQENVVEEIFYNIINNQQLASIGDAVDGQRSIIFLDGPTGTGKTAIIREITECLGIPFVSTSITNYSSTGYVGGDITDVLKSLCKKANGSLITAQRGIVVFDEFDKIAYSRVGGLEMKRAVQQQLLDFLGGGKYDIRLGNSFVDREEVAFDTSKLTFVCLGALTDLRVRKTERHRGIGFGQDFSSQDNSSFSITPQDLMGIGLERELVGRFNTYLHTNSYTKDDLLNILKNSTISPLIGFIKLVENNKKKMVIEDDVYEYIAEQAYNLNLGARGLQTVINSIRTHYLRKILRDEDKTITLDLETIRKIFNDTMNRKG